MESRLNRLLYRLQGKKDGDLKRLPPIGISYRDIGRTMYIYKNGPTQAQIEMYKTHLAHYVGQEKSRFEGTPYGVIPVPISLEKYTEGMNSILANNLSDFDIKWQLRDNARQQLENWGYLQKTPQE